MHGNEESHRSLIAVACSRFRSARVWSKRFSFFKSRDIKFERVVQRDTKAIYKRELNMPSALRFLDIIQTYFAIQQAQYFIWFVSSAAHRGI